jgi:hypothetical protein
MDSGFIVLEATAKRLGFEDFLSLIVLNYEATP